jgi:hypothetical protein
LPADGAPTANSADATIRTEQRFIDEDRTQPLEGSFNVFRGREFIGTVYALGDAWQYGAFREERCQSFEEAVQCNVSLFDRRSAANVGDVVVG